MSKRTPDEIATEIILNFDRAFVEAAAMIARHGPGTKHSAALTANGYGRLHLDIVNLVTGYQGTVSDLQNKLAEARLGKTEVPVEPPKTRGKKVKISKEDLWKIWEKNGFVGQVAAKEIGIGMDSFRQYCKEYNLVRPGATLPNKETVLQTWENCRWIITHSAKALNISEEVFRRLLKEYDLKRPWDDSSKDA